jgi:hypothetical protein
MIPPRPADQKDDVAGPKKAGVITLNATDLISLMRLLAMTIVWIVLAFFLAYYAVTGGIGRFIGAIDVTNVKMFGVELNIDRRKSELVEKLKRDSDGPRDAKAGKSSRDFFIDPEMLMGAIRRAEINAGAVRGGRLLWVDDEPQNNSAAIDLLSQLGVTVVAVTNNDDALNLLRNAKFDLVVTDGGRGPGDDAKGPPLQLCPLQYRDVPNLHREKFSTLASFNEQVRNGSYVPGGFRLVEGIATDEADYARTDDKKKAWAVSENTGEPSPRYADVMAPRIIMYSASNGDIAYNPCIRTVTRRTDYLFNAIISILEESRAPVEARAEGDGNH